MGKIKKLPKKVIIFAILIVILLVLLSVFIKPSKHIISNEEALMIGETKYLEFLWMVDGAFNYDRYDQKEFTVNNKNSKNKLDFTCTYHENKKTCQATNFERNFEKVFANNITMNIVYGDGVAIKWYSKNNDGYEFSNSNNCPAGRMSLNHSLKVNNVGDNKITYQVTFDEKITNGTYKGDHHYDKEFVLVYQDGLWKVSEAYYHDPCYAEYLIK